MLIVMMAITSCNSNNEKMFIVEEEPISIDYMGPSIFDTLFVHEQIQPDKSIKYTFEYRNSDHDIYIVESCTTVYGKNGKKLGFNKFLVVRSMVENMIDKIMEDDNVSEDDKLYVKAAYRQIYLNNFFPHGERMIYNLKIEIDRYKNEMEEGDPELYDIYKESYDSDIKMLKEYMKEYPDVDTADVYKLYV